VEVLGGGGEVLGVGEVFGEREVEVEGIGVGEVIGDVGYWGEGVEGGVI
jgi:hypothetical protein